MSDRRVSIHDLVTATDRADVLAFELNAAAVWASEQAGDESAGDLFQEAAVKVLAAARLLDRPIRAKLPPDRWQAASG